MTLHRSLITFILTLTFISNTNAQGTSNSFGQPQLAMITGTSITDNAAGAAFPRANINIKAVRDFTKSFKNAENIRWYVVPGGIMVYFTEQGITARVGYDSKGNWLYYMRSYTEAGLPREIRAQLKSIYYDYTISRVNEITLGKQLIFLVQIQDGNTLKTIRICDGEMETVEEMEKSN